MKILEAIREATSENHKRLENSTLLLSISQKDLSLENYILILKKFYGFFQPLEQSIGVFQSSLSQLLPDYSTRRKAEWLQQDLNALVTDTDAKLICTDLPKISQLAEAWGCLYVLEGSTLGGKMISRVVEACLGLGPRNGASFFNGYGEETGTRWKNFTKALTEYSTASGEDEKTIAAANETFLKFGQWINQSV
jgi:heme oxygenase